MQNKCLYSLGWFIGFCFLKVYQFVYISTYIITHPTNLCYLQSIIRFIQILSYLSIGSNNFFCEIWGIICFYVSQNGWNSFRMKPHWKKFDAINYFSSKKSLICSLSLSLLSNVSQYEIYVNIRVAIDYLNSSIRFSSVYMQFRYIYAIPIYMCIMYHVARISYICVLLIVSAKRQCPM